MSWRDLYRLRDDGEILELSRGVYQLAEAAGSGHVDTAVALVRDVVAVEVDDGIVFDVDLLAEQGPLLSEPYTRQLDGKLRELRFHLGGQAVRVTYWIASGRRIVLLTVFGKTRMRQVREIDRARGRCGDVLLRGTPWTMMARSEGDVAAV